MKTVLLIDIYRMLALALGADTVTVPTEAEATTETDATDTGAETETVGNDAKAVPGGLTCADGAVTVTVGIVAKAFAFAA